MNDFAFIVPRSAFIAAFRRRAVYVLLVVLCRKENARAGGLLLPAQTVGRRRRRARLSIAHRRRRLPSVQVWPAAPSQRGVPRAITVADRRCLAAGGNLER